MNLIIKKLIYQRIYSRYKELFEIDINEIQKVGVDHFIAIHKKITLGESEYIIKYFRLENNTFKDYFSGNKGKIVISMCDTDNLKISMQILRKLYSLQVDFKIIYKLDLHTHIINSNFLSYIKEKDNVAFYLKGKYNKYSFIFLKKIQSIFSGKDVYIGLDYLKKQEDVNNKIIFEIINYIKEKGGNINNDLIRLESAFRGIYVLGPKELHLDLYEFCNASCNFCVTNGPGFLTERDHNENKHKLTFSGSEYINLFKNISHSQTESLALGITGEPFIHPEIKYILKELVHVNLKIGFLTNGYKLLENINLILNNKHISHFYINISSGNLKSFNKTRPGDNFTNFINTWNAIKIIRQERPDIIVRCLYVITPLNIDGISDFIDLCKKNNVSEIELKRVVPYEFSNKLFFFSNEKINTIKKIVQSYKNNIDTINNNFDYIINDFNEILNGSAVQYPESEEIDLSKLNGKTMNCYNSYFYIALFRNSAYTCGKFIGKLGKLTHLDLYELLFEKKNVLNILKASENIKVFLGEKKWKEKCSRCHHLDAIGIVKDYIKYKNISLKLEND